MAQQGYDLYESMGYLIARTFRTMGNRMNRNFREAGLDISLEQWTVLVRLWEKDGQNQQDLADKCYKDKTSITRLIDGLEKRGYVKRVPDKSDKRYNLIYLTKTGITIRAELEAVAFKTLQEAQGDISTANWELTKEVMRHMYDNLNPEQVEPL